MAAAGAVWRTRDGIRRVSPTASLSVDVSAYTNPNSPGAGGEGDIARVEFYVSENGGPPTTHTVNAKAVRKPNYSDCDAPHPGVSGMVPTHLWGITLGCSAAAPGITVAYGRIEITATAFSAAGTATPLPGSLVFYNDADGVDRRPSSVVRYVSEAGNDAWDGTVPYFVSGTTGPKKTIANALGTGECGGKILVGIGALEWFGSLGGSVWTSDREWCTLIMAPGAVLRRGAAINTVFFTTPGQRFWFRVWGGEIRGQFLDIDPGAGSNGMVWCDGLYHHSEHYRPDRPCTVLYEGPESQGGQFGFYFDNEGDDSNWQQYASCCGVVGLHKGFANMADIHDCEAAYIMAEAVVSNNSVHPGGQSFLNLYHHDQVAGTHLVSGWFSSLVHTGNLTISTAGLPPGQAKLSQTGPMFIAVFGTTDDVLAPVDIAFTGIELVGLSPNWLLKCSGFSAPGNNGDFPVVGAGYDGGTPYVIISNANAVSGAQNQGRLQTGRSDSGLGPWSVVDPHGDLWHGDGAHVNCILENYLAVNVWHCQSIFLVAAVNALRCWFVNWAISNPYQTIGDFLLNWTGTTTDCGILGCTLDCTGTIGGTNTRLTVVDNVFRSVNLVAGAGAFVDRNHFVSGTTYGSNVTTGTWYAQQPIDNNWSWLPDAGRLNAGSGLWARPSEFRWPGATADTKGADRSVGLQDWSIAGAVVITPGPLGVTRHVVDPVVTLGDVVVTPPPIATTLRVSGPTILIVGNVSVLGGGSRPYLPRDGSIGLAQLAVPSDAAEPFAANRLFFGSTGAVSLLLEDGSTIVIQGVAGKEIVLRHTRVNATGTTAVVVRKF